MKIYIKNMDRMMAILVAFELRAAGYQTNLGEESIHFSRAV
jgi:hypothetical protein